MSVVENICSCILVLCKACASFCHTHSLFVWWLCVQVMLQKFLRVAGDMVSPPMYVPYVDMLAALANTSTNSQCCFAWLRSSGPTWRVSLEHIFSSIRQYFVSLKHDSSASAGMDSRSVLSAASHRHSITEEELNGLVAVLKLIEQLVDMVREEDGTVCGSLFLINSVQEGGGNQIVHTRNSV